MSSKCQSVVVITNKTNEETSWEIMYEININLRSIDMPSQLILNTSLTD